MIALASPPLPHTSHSTPLPCLALRRRPDAPKHLPIANNLWLSMDAVEPPKTTSLLRKKSGELVKPSLKQALSGDVPKKSLSRSAPATPTAKCVHFDAQLEHVRLFLAEQKPTAVSRDGSPTETSEGDEFPWRFDERPFDEEQARRNVRVKATNLADTSLGDADVRVQSLTLSDGALVGRVLVRNLAFEKRVTARFTFDWWQTTSEVSARYVESPFAGVDCFAFTIKLGDVLHRIEEKTLFVAVRYNVAGREIWDSNNGQNYMVSFARDKDKPSPKEKPSPKDKRYQLDLRKSLERAMQDDEDAVPPLKTRGMSFSGFDKPSVASLVDTKLGARYDFGAAPRERPSADGFRMPELSLRPRTSSKRPPLSTERLATDVPQAKSPRDAEDMFHADLSPPALAPRRHHHRASYFDGWSFAAPGVKRSVSGAPCLDNDDKDWAADLGGSAASTPSVTSASSPSQSPSSPSEYLPSPEMAHAHLPKHNYSSFLDQFCFFTGSEGPLCLESTPTTTPRAGSPAHQLVSA